MRGSNRRSSSSAQAASFVFGLGERLACRNQQRREIAPRLDLLARPRWIVQHHDTGIGEPVDRPSDLEFGGEPSASASEWRSRSPSTAARTSHSNGIRSSSSLPCPRAMEDAARRPRWANLRRNPGPFVHPARRFHQQRFGRKPNGRLHRGEAGASLLEQEVPLRPAKELEHRLLDLGLDLSVQLATRNHPEPDQDVADPPPISFALQCTRTLEIGRGDSTGPEETRSQRLTVVADRGRNDSAAIEAHGPRRLEKLGRHPEDTALPAQIQQLEDVLDVQLLEGAFECHGLSGRGGEDVLQVPRGPRAGPSLGRVRSGRVELDDPLPRLHSLIELPLPREHGATVIERAGVIPVEPEHSLECLHGLRGSPIFEQRATKRGEGLELVGVGLENSNEHIDRGPGDSIRLSRSASASAAAA